MSSLVLDLFKKILKKIKPLNLAEIFGFVDIIKTQKPKTSFTVNVLDNLTSFDSGLTF